MGKCTHCGKPAGFFRSVHKECEEAHVAKKNRQQQLRTNVFSAARNSVQGRASFDDVRTAVAAAQESGLSSYEMQKIGTSAWESALDAAQEDKLLDEDQATLLVDLQSVLGATRDDLERSGAWMKLVKAAVLRDVVTGSLPQRVKFDTPPVNLQKNEVIAWAFRHAEYFEEKTRREFVGRSQGVSVRIAKGLYYRTGVFKGHPVTHTERVKVDSGWLIATNKHLYFAGPIKTFRVPYSKIVAFQPYEDGIGIMRDAASAKPQTFTVDDGWFAYNLITNLAAL
jgi:hypothetical protein